MAVGFASLADRWQVPAVTNNTRRLIVQEKKDARAQRYCYSWSTRDTRSPIDDGWRYAGGPSKLSFCCALALRLLCACVNHPSRDAKFAKCDPPAAVMVGGFRASRVGARGSVNSAAQVAVLGGRVLLLEACLWPRTSHDSPIASAAR
ncbi:hypothetical protein LIA77_00611 [Sarocladium implicatum]|nr:hypothetical protein LIA77_00611 [Sarocladium implicatum]